HFNRLQQLCNGEHGRGSAAPQRWPDGRLDFAWPGDRPPHGCAGSAGRGSGMSAKKCPAVVFLGVAQSPKSSHRQDSCDITACYDTCKHFLLESFTIAVRFLPCTFDTMN